MTVESVQPTPPVAPPGHAVPRPDAGDADRPERDPLRADAVAAPTREQLESRVAEESARFEALKQSLTFRVHEGSGQLMVQVVDRDTGRVLREAPPKEFLDLTVRLREMVGFFLDETR